MRVIPVIDLLGGQVVRGVAGRREEYRPIVSQIAADARPATVARALVERFGFDTAYVADLDAIMLGRPDVRAWSEIARAGLKLWLDAGTGTIDFSWHIIDQLAVTQIDARLVVGLESLESQEVIWKISGVLEDVPPIFSVDLQCGRPLVRNPAWKNMPALEIVSTVKSLGVRETIVLDLADVGVGGGTRTLELCREIASKFPGQGLVAGGGVRGWGDLEAMAGAGCTHALVASALHDGSLTREDVRRTTLDPRLQTPDS
jgi:phosphoribosylformimino-5-aminoimidazole carboxamide ribotide isomerase